MDRTEKQAFVKSLAAVFQATEMIVVSRNRGLTVAEASDLRRRMRAAGATYRVAKNRLAMRALAGTRFTDLGPLLKGPTALAWSADPVAVAKVAVGFAKTNDRFVVVGGALGPRALDARGVEALAELPSLETLRAQLAGMLQLPAQRLAAVLAAPAGGLARVFGAYAQT
jgi:large subunit ribosomal protein L10